MDIMELFGCFGLTRQEATLYLQLCSKGRMTGYEAAKLSGISTSNTYMALASLVDKGAAWIEEDNITRYTPVPIDEFCGSRLRKMQEYRQLLVDSVPRRTEPAEGYITIKGEGNILDKMKDMIEKAQERLYVAVSQQTLEKLLPQLENALERGLKVVVITDPPFLLGGAMVYHTKTRHDQIRLIADSENVLTGDISLGKESTCLYSQKQNLVDLFKESLKNEIELIKLTAED